MGKFKEKNWGGQGYGRCGNPLYDLTILYGFPHVVFVSNHAAFEWWSGQREPWRSLNYCPMVSMEVEELKNLQRFKGTHKIYSATYHSHL